MSLENKELFYVSTQPNRCCRDLVFCNLGKSELYVEGAMQNRNFLLLRHLQPGVDKDSRFTEWSPPFGMDVLYYIIYRGLQSGKLMQVYEIRDIADAIAVLIIVGASAGLLKNATDRFFSIKFITSFESRGFLLKIVNKMNSRSHTDKLVFNVRVYFEEID